MLNTEELKTYTLKHFKATLESAIVQIAIDGYTAYFTRKDSTMGKFVRLVQSELESLGYTVESDESNIIVRWPYPFSKQV